MANFIRKYFFGIFPGWLARLRFPYLVELTTVVFLVNLMIPDAIPFVDEIIMGLIALLLGKIRKKPVIDKQTPNIQEKLDEYPIP